MADKKKRLVFSILQFLESSIKDGTIKQDDVEGIEVAVQCIGEAFGVDPQDPEQKSLYSTKHALPIIFNMAVEAEERLSKKTGPSGTFRAVPVSAKTEPEKKPNELTEEEKKKSEDLKAAGNRKVAERDYAEAVKLYGEAIVINPNNAVYYANRAAAYSQMGQHEKAIDDATKSTQIDPSYSKAYSRLGHAYYSINKYQEAVEAYEKGLSLDPNNTILKNALAAAEKQVSEIKKDQGPNRTPSDHSSPTAPGGGLPEGLAGLAGLGGGASGGGIDFSSLMNNPQLMSMASQMMQSGAFNDLLNNPNLAQMANNMMRSGQPPNIQEAMNNPELMNMARQFANNRPNADAPGQPSATNDPQDEDETASSNGKDSS
ncbi:hypothetical protein G9A89_013717 [Geosiphon pyriformis]|nr:hypothetical protein G9A89_013717 [Geosiphon pyriformis]